MIIATSGQNLFVHSDRIRPRCNGEEVETEEQEEMESEESMSVSDWEIEHNIKEAMKDSLHKSDME